MHEPGRPSCIDEAAAHELTDTEMRVETVIGVVPLRSPEVRHRPDAQAPAQLAEEPSDVAPQRKGVMATATGICQGAESVEAVGRAVPPYRGASATRGYTLRLLGVGIASGTGSVSSRVEDDNSFADVPEESGLPIAPRWNEFRSRFELSEICGRRLIERLGALLCEIGDEIGRTLVTRHRG